MKALRSNAKYLALILLILGLGFISDASYIHAKAVLAQYLIAKSWQGGQYAPWPWADTWPVARLRYQDEDLYVLSGSHGSSLAFGPGHVDGTALPGRSGVSVVAGHRDTHFAFLSELAVGDEVSVQSEEGKWQTYTVISMAVVDTSDSNLMVLDGGLNQMTLVTCYPFDTIEPGGPLRYVVTAKRREESHEEIPRPRFG